MDVGETLDNDAYCGGDLVGCLEGVGMGGGEEDGFDADAVLGADLDHEVRNLHIRKITTSGNSFVTFKEAQCGNRESDNGMGLTPLL